MHKTKNAKSHKIVKQNYINYRMLIRRSILFHEAQTTNNINRKTIKEQ